MMTQRLDNAVFGNLTAIHSPVDLKTQKITGTNCQIKIHLSIETIKFLMKYNLQYFVSKFLLDIQFSLLNTITKFEQVS